jgi:hypothetical protein
MGEWAHLPGHPNCIWRASAADEWALSPHAMGGVPWGPGDKQPDSLSMLHTIPGVGLAVTSHRFGFPCSMNSGAQGHRPPTLPFQSSVSQSNNVLPHL